MLNEAPIVGIDLGTTNSLVAVADERGPRVLAGPGGESDAILPSVVRYEDDGSVTVGAVARDEAPLHPRTTVSSVKRLMGRSVADASGDLGFLGYDVVEGPQNTCRVRLPNRDEPVAPEQVSAEVLRALKDRASAELGVDIMRAVVTVPAYFDDAQRQATRTAGRLAGLEVVRIVNEPTAAALAYGFGLDRSAERNKADRTIAVYDLGGGTFDVSILRVTPAQEEGQTSFFEVISTAGDTRLGGDDADHLLISLFFDEMKEKLGLEAPELSALPPETRRALKQFAAGVKHKLSEDEAAQVRIDTGAGVYDRTVTREEFEALISPWAEKTRKVCERALRDAQKVLKGQDPLHILGTGEQVRCYTYGGDLAKGIATAMSHPSARNEDFNISTARQTTVLELAQLIWEKVHGTGGDAPPFRTVSDPAYPHDVQLRVPDVTKARERLGFEAATSLAEVLDEVIPWIRQEIQHDRI